MNNEKISKNNQKERLEIRERKREREKVEGLNLIVMGKKYEKVIRS